MLDKRYLDLQRATSDKLNQLGIGTLESGQLVDPADVIEVQPALQHAEFVVQDYPNAQSVDAFKEEIKQLRDIDEWFYSYKTGKGLTFDELQDYYNIITKGLE